MATEKTSVLNELIEINNDRIAGFEKVTSDINDKNIDLKELFLEFASQSRENTQELTAIVARQTDDVETGTSTAGTLHRAWIDVKSLFGGSDRHSILAEAERGEDAIKKAYEKALQEEYLTAEDRSLLTKQASQITSAHDQIKALRDASN